MKKSISTLSALMIGLTSISFVSCSDSDSNGGSNTAGGDAAIEAVNPAKVFSQLPTSINGQSIRTDASGRVISIGNVATFDYNLSTSRSEESYDVAMRVNGYTIFICLNSEGFIRHAESREHEWTISYNSDAQIRTIDFYDKDEKERIKLDFSWKNGNMVLAEGQNHSISAKAEVKYTDPSNPSGIVNKDRYFFMNDGIGGFDFEELQWAYYAGMLGIGCENLPLELKQTVGRFYSSVETYSWTLSNGYPSMLRMSYIDDEDGEIETGEETFWYNFN